MKKIVWVRIDDRLIHGQVMTAWVKYADANEVVIIDEQLKNDVFTKTIMQSLIPKTLKLTVLGQEEAVTYLKEDDPKARIIILTKGPEPLLHLIKEGVAYDSINLGGMGMRTGRKTLFKHISTSEEENAIFKELLANNVEVSVRIVPTDKAVTIEKYLK